MADLKTTQIHGKATVKVIDTDASLTDFLVRYDLTSCGNRKERGLIYKTTVSGSGTSGSSGS